MQSGRHGVALQDPGAVDLVVKRQNIGTVAKIIRMRHTRPGVLFLRGGKIQPGEAERESP